MIAAPIVFDERVHRLDSVEAIYRFLVARIESCVSTNNHGLTEGETTILVDSVRPMDLSVVKENASWDNLISMLILTLPEFRWAFAFTGKVPELSGELKEPYTRIFEKDHNRYSVFGHWRHPLLDPTGLREWVLDKIPLVGWIASSTKVVSISTALAIVTTAIAARVAFDETGVLVSFFILSFFGLGVLFGFFWLGSYVFQFFRGFVAGAILAPAILFVPTFFLVSREDDD